MQGVDFTIHGHTIFPTPRKNANALFIGTGCFAGGTLTALDLNAFAQSESLDKASVFSV